MNSNRKYLVTGGNGKIGSLLIQRPDFVFLDCDVTNISSIMEAEYTIWGEEENDCDIVVNLAAMSSVDACQNDYDKAIKVNTHGLANLHKVFGERVLNISSDQVFSGKNLFLPAESSKPSPINSYGFSKLGAETVSNVFGGKTLRLSRTVAYDDPDLLDYMTSIMLEGLPTEIPTFFSRNYMHREFAVDAIEYFARNYDNMPKVVNYGGLDHVTMFGFMKLLVMELGLDPSLVKKNNKYDDSLTPRPRNGGFKVWLAKELGFPMFSITDTVSRLAKDYHV